MCFSRPIRTAPALLHVGEVETQSGDVNSIYKYNLSTGKAKKLLPFEATGPIIARNGMLYHIDNGVLKRTDGSITETVLIDNERVWASNYNLYKNYMFYFKNDYRNGSLDPGTLYALDVDTGQEYKLFTIKSDFSIDFYVMENSVFLFSGFDDSIVYQITFEDNMAKLWKLNGLS